MIQPPALPSRRSIRLQGHDYSLPGDYFVTICADAMRCMFGRVKCGHIRLSPLGEMIFSCWREIPMHCPCVELDVFVVMPNHLHGLVRLTRPVKELSSAVPGEIQSNPISLSAVIQRFKSFTTSKYLQGIPDGRWKQHTAKLWQRGFYDRVIRNQKELDDVRTYIYGNPMRWRAESV